MVENNGAGTDNKAVGKAEEPTNTKDIVPPQPNSPLPQKVRDDSPTGEGNTIGKIIGQAPQATNPPHEANTVVLPETKEEKGAWEQIRDYFDTGMVNSIDADAEERAAILEMTGQKKAAENLRAVADNTRQNVDKFRATDFAIGAAKRVNNLAVDAAEAVTKLQGNASALDAQARAAELEAFGQKRPAESVRNTGTAISQNIQEFNLDSKRKSFDNPMQKGGEMAFDTGMTVSLVGEIPSILKGIGSFFKLGKQATKQEVKSTAKTETQAAGDTKGASIEGKSAETAETAAPTKPQNNKQDSVDNKSNNKEGQNNNKTTPEGDPVDMATGDFLQVWPVIAIPGLLPITLTRTYRSTAKFSGLFGSKWADDWSRQLELADGKVNFTDADGVIYDFSTPDNTVLARNQHIPHYVLTGELNGELQLTDRCAQLSYHFNHAVGNIRRLSAITDRRQNTIQFVYDKQSQLIEVTRTDGFRLVLGYQGQQLQTVDYLEPQKQQRLVTCHYDPQGYLHECDAFQHNHLWHEYDVQGRMTRWHDTDQTDLSLTYDEQGRVLSTTSPSGYWCDRFHYDDNARITTYRDGEGGETQYHYDHNGLIVREVDPLGRITRRQWRYSQIVWEADPAGGITTFDYNPDGALTEVKLPTGDTFAYGYDEHGQLIESVLPTGERWQFHYDEQGNLTAVTNPLGHKEAYQYGTHGELRQRLLPDGRAWHYAYDEHQRLAAVMTPDGETTSLQL
ncbi:RHS repeat protein, partial [Xenorhabdus sp. DI]|uniref:DUF6531 domain-containing protein n=1 Tax=Xenorhabdus doucetiae TaxID=351671 RepID=UPI0019995C50